MSGFSSLLRTIEIGGRRPLRVTFGVPVSGSVRCDLLRNNKNVKSPFDIDTDALVGRYGDGNK